MVPKGHRIDRKLTESQNWFSSVLDSISNAVVVINTTGKLIFMNHLAEKLTGWKQEEALGKAFEEVINIVNEQTGHKVEKHIKKVLEDGLTLNMEDDNILITREGNKIPIDSSAAPINDENDNIIGVVLVFHDIIKRKKMEDLIIDAKKEWEETFDIINDAITIHDKDFNIIRANKTAGKMLGSSFYDILNKKCYELYHGTAYPPELCPSCRTLKTGIPTTTEIFEPNLNKYIEIKALPRFDKNNQLIGVVHVVRDITKRKEMEDELRALSLVDELTGLYNRRGFFTLAEQQLKIARRLKRGLLILYADIDGFKKINDKFGHKEGDKALIETAGILKEIFRESDIIARIGGDEFVVYAVEITDINPDILHYRLQKQIEAHNLKREHDLKIMISIGIVQYEKECPYSIDELLAQADKLMYEQKKERKLNIDYG